MKKEFQAGTADEQRTDADFSTSTSVEASPMLSAALSRMEGNKLIAEFMCPNSIRARDFFGGKGSKYHSSWDWLMPVVEKINKLNKMVSINLWSEMNATECKIYNWELGAPYQETECEEPIKAVWSCVVEFIKWYNNAVSVGSR